VRNYDLVCAWLRPATFISHWRPQAAAIVSA
jgi:hypothetical protein